LINFNKHSSEQNVLVVGFSYRTGLQTANFLAEKGYAVSISDIKQEKDLSPLIEKLNENVKVYAANQKMSLLDNNYDFIVLSPGVPAKIDLIQEAYRRSIPVISEVELAFNFMQGRWIAITGTDGKSTTTALTNYILNEIGEKSFEGGNIGIPLISLVDKTDPDSIIVAELSSYQLETIDKLKPDVSAILNLTPDHLDRYATIDDYFDAKLRITKNQDANNYLIYNFDDENILKRVASVNSNKVSFSLTDTMSDAYYKSGYINVKLNGTYEKVIEVAKLKLIGIHNVQNIMTAILIIKSLYKQLDKLLPIDKIQQACYSFSGLAHRMENVGVYKGRHFINDSKATTVGAVEMALKSNDKSAVFIIGGKAKGDDYSRLANLMKGSVKGLVLIGETSDEFSKLFNKIPNIIAGDMDDAVVKSMQMTEDGDTIILSPACASFDMYENFEMRGDIFKEAFQKLNSGGLEWTSSQ
jgi:UDP-N-acetylmuramoylalanine--D-glutamate ligase